MSLTAAQSVPVLRRLHGNPEELLYPDSKHSEQPEEWPPLQESSTLFCGEAVSLSLVTLQHALETPLLSLCSGTLTLIANVASVA